MYFGNHLQNYGNLHRDTNADVIGPTKYDNNVYRPPQQNFQTTYKPLILNQAYEPRRQVNNNFNQLQQQGHLKSKPMINFINSNKKESNSPYQQAYVGNTVSNPAYIKKNQFFKARQSFGNMNDQLKYRPNFSPNPSDDISIKKHYIRSTIDLKTKNYLNQNSNQKSYCDYNNISNTSIDQRQKFIDANKFQEISSELVKNRENQNSTNSCFNNNNTGNHNFSDINKNLNDYDYSNYAENHNKQTKQNVFDLNFQTQFQCSQLKKNDYKFTTPLNSKKTSQIQIKTQYSGTLLPSQIKTVTELQSKSYQNPYLNRSSSSYYFSNDIKSKFQKTLQNSKLLRRQSYASSQSNNKLKMKSNIQMNEQQVQNVQKLKSQVGKLKEEDKKNKQKVQYLQRIIQNKNETIEELQKLINQSKRRNNNNNYNYKIQKDQQDETGYSGSSGSSLLETIKQKQLFASNLQSQLNKYKSYLNEKTNQIFELKQNLEEASKMKSIHQAKFKIIQQQLNSLQTQTYKQKLRHQKQIKTKQQQSSLQISNINQKIQRLQTQNQTLQKQHRQQQSKHQTQANQYHMLNSQLQAQTRSLTEKIYIIQTELATTLQKNNKYKNQKHILMQSNQNLQKQKPELLKQIQSQKQKVTKLQKQLENKQLKITNLQKVISKTTTSQQSSNLKQKIFQQQVQYLKQKLQAKQSNCSKLQDQLKAKTKQIQILIFQNVQLQNKVQKTSSKLKDLLNSSENTSQKQNSYKRQLNSLIDQKNQEAQVYLNTIKQLNDVIQVKIIRQKQLQKQKEDSETQHQSIIEKYQQQLDLLLEEKNNNINYLQKQDSLTKLEKQNDNQHKTISLLQECSKKQILLNEYHSKYFQIVSYFNLQNIKQKKQNQSLTGLNFQQIQQNINESVPSSKVLNQIHKQLKEQIERIHKDLKKLVLVLKDNETQQLKTNQKLFQVQKSVKKCGMKINQVSMQLNSKNTLIQQINKRIIQSHLSTLELKYQKISEQ